MHHHIADKHANKVAARKDKHEREAAGEVRHHIIVTSLEPRIRTSYIIVYIAIECPTGYIIIYDNKYGIEYLV